jgi:hypothetical protein
VCRDFLSAQETDIFVGGRYRSRCYAVRHLEGHRLGKTLSSAEGFAAMHAQATLLEFRTENQALQIK